LYVVDSQTRLDQCMLTEKGLPIVSITNGRSYTYSADLTCWLEFKISFLNNHLFLFLFIKHFTFWFRCLVMLTISEFTNKRSFEKFIIFKPKCHKCEGHVFVVSVFSLNYGLELFLFWVLICLILMRYL